MTNTPIRPSGDTQTYRYLALVSYLTLLVWVGLWHFQFSPHPHINSNAVTIAWLIPLLFPLAGILTGKPYTHAWANFILMFYFLHALTVIYIDEGERWLVIIELLLTSVSFVSNILYAKFKGRELGLKLPRLSQVEKQEKQKFTGK